MTLLAERATRTTFEAQCGPRVSYVMATKNRPKELATALEHAKTYLKATDELIVISGSAESADDEIVRAAGGVAVYVREPDQNPAHATNKGVLLASGVYVKLVPDDDIFHSEGLETVYAAMDADPSLGVLVGGGTKVRQNPPATAICCVPDGVGYCESIDAFFQYGATGVGTVYRRSVFALAGLFAPIWLLADFEHVIRCFKSGVKVRACRANTFLHPVYPYSTLEKDKPRVNTEAGELKRIYGASAYIEPGLRITDPVWDGKVV